MVDSNPLTLNEILCLISHDFSQCTFNRASDHFADKMS